MEEEPPCSCARPLRAVPHRRLLQKILTPRSWLHLRFLASHCRRAHTAPSTLPASLELLPLILCPPKCTHLPTAAWAAGLCLLRRLECLYSFPRQTLQLVIWILFLLCLSQKITSTILSVSLLHPRDFHSPGSMPSTYIYICICIYRNIYIHTYIHNEFKLSYIYMCVCVYECIFIHTLIWDFPGGASGKESTCQCRRLRDASSIPGSGRSLEEGMAVHSRIPA